MTKKNKRWLSIITMGIAIGLLMPISVQAAITNEGVVKLFNLHDDYLGSYSQSACNDPNYRTNIPEVLIYTSDF